MGRQLAWRRSLRRCGADLARRQPYPEGGALTGRAVHADLAAHGLHQAAAERQADAGALDARALGAQALEGLEQAVLILVAQALAFIAHAQPDAVVGLAALQHHCAAGPVVLDRIADQVQEHLHQARAVGLHGQATAGRYPVGWDPNPLALAQRLHQGQRLAHQRFEVDGLQFHRKPALLDAPQVQQAIDEVEQMARPGQDFVDLELLRWRQGPLFVAGQQLPEAQNGVQGRAQLVRHLRQELRLGLAGALCLFLGSHQRVLRALALGDVDAEGVEGLPAVGAAGASHLDDLDGDRPEAMCIFVGTLEAPGLSSVGKTGLDVARHAHQVARAQKSLDRLAHDLFGRVAQPLGCGLIDEAVAQVVLDGSDVARERPQ